jgi:hypothetical protein
MEVRRFALVAASVLLVSSCGGGDKPGAEGIPDKVEGRVSPLTGLPQENPPENPPFLTKIENTEAGEPQTGLNQADLVIEELVEGGYTRLAAVFYSKLPTKVGHVRSTRTTDIGLAKPVGATIVASGGASKTLDVIKSSNVDIYTYDAGDPGFSKDPGKSAPYHVLWDLTTLAKTAKATELPPKNYFTWGDGPAAADVTKKATSASVAFSPTVTTKWSFSGGKWNRSPERAAAGETYKPDTVIVIFARVTDAGYNDAAGNPVPETVLQGSGRAVVFSGDNATEATWSKKALDSTMTFTAKKTGKPVTIKPGHVFLEAAPRGGDVTF